MTDKQVLASCTSMIFAGSETTAISLSSVFHFLLTNPRVYSTLMNELDEATNAGIIADRENQKVSWAEAQKLPYLDAVIQESFRTSFDSLFDPRLPLTTKFPQASIQQLVSFLSA